MSVPVQNDASNQRRSRIVVNLDRESEGIPHSPQGQQPYAVTRKRKKWPIVLTIIGGVLLILVVVAFIYWQNYKTKPAYSLALAINAAQRNDIAAFDEVFDTDRVVGNFTPQVIDEALGRFGTALTPGIRKSIEDTVTSLTPNFRDRVRDEAMKHVRDAAKRAEGKPFFLLALTIPYLVDIKQEGDTAQITAKSGDHNVELTMERNDKRWKVVGVKDASLAKRIVDDITKDLPAIGTDLIDEAGKQIKKRLPDILPNVSGATGKGKRR